MLHSISDSELGLFECIIYRRDRNQKKGNALRGGGVFKAVLKTITDPQ